MCLIIVKPSGQEVTTELTNAISHGYKNNKDGVGYAYSGVNSASEKGFYFKKGLQSNISEEDILHLVNTKITKDTLFAIHFRRGNKGKATLNNVQPLLIDLNVPNMCKNEGFTIDKSLFFHNGTFLEDALNGRANLNNDAYSDSVHFVYNVLGFQDNILKIANDGVGYFKEFYNKGTIASYNKLCVLNPQNLDNKNETLLLTDNFICYKGLYFSNGDFTPEHKVVKEDSDQLIFKYSLPKISREKSFVINTTRTVYSDAYGQGSYSGYDSSYGSSYMGNNVSNTNKRTEEETDKLFNPNKGKLFTTQIPPDFYEEIIEEKVEEKVEEKQNIKTKTNKKRSNLIKTCNLSSFPLNKDNHFKIELIIKENALNIPKSTRMEIVKVMNDIGCLRVSFTNSNGSLTNRILTFEELKDLCMVVAKRGYETFLNDFLLIKSKFPVNKKRLKKFEKSLIRSKGIKEDTASIKGVGQRVNVDSLELYINNGQKILEQMKVI